MVKRVASVTNWGRSGLSDWLIQRVSAVIIGAYTLCLLGYLLMQPNLDYVQWQAFITCLPMQIFTLLMLLSVAAHAWIGLWTITTDYIKPTCIRIATQLILALLTFIYFIWAILVMWSV
jgi:succinate dehydrogenase / fumarate reductase, membrane anchor subunit